MPTVMKGRLDEFLKIGADARTLRDLERFAAKAADVAHRAASELPFGTSPRGYARDFADLAEDRPDR